MNATVVLAMLLVPGGHTTKTMRRACPPSYLLSALPAAVPITSRSATSLERVPRLAPLPVEADPFKKPAVAAGAPNADVDQATPVSAITVERGRPLSDPAIEQALAMADGIIDGIPVGLQNRFNVATFEDLISGPYIQGLGLWGLAEIGPGVLYPHPLNERGRPGSPGGAGGGRGQPLGSLLDTLMPGPNPQVPEPSSIAVWTAAFVGLFFARRRKLPPKAAMPSGAPPTE